MSNFLEYRELRVVYKRYASLFFCFAVDTSDNELGALEVIHRLAIQYFEDEVEILVFVSFSVI